MQYFLSPLAGTQYCLREESLNGTQSRSLWQGSAHRLNPSPLSRHSPAQQSSEVVQRAPGRVGIQTFCVPGPETSRQQA